MSLYWLSVIPLGMAFAGLFIFVWGLMNPRYHTDKYMDDSSTPGQEDEALGCVLADPGRDYLPRIRVLAGRAAIRRLMKQERRELRLVAK